MSGEFLLPAPTAATDELLWRQVTPRQYDETTRKPASQAFGPMPSDLYKPSFSRSSQISAQAARDWHQDHANSPSRGVWAVSVDEVRQAGSRAVDNSQVPPANPADPQAPAHCYVDYRDVPKPERKEIFGQLLMRALRRDEISTEAKRFHKDVAAEADAEEGEAEKAEVEQVD